MTTNLFYFSATGNSLVVARDIAEGLTNTTIYSIPDVIGGEIDLDADNIGIIYPVYFAGLPRIVSDFIKRIDPKKVKYLFTVCTFGALAAGSLLMAEEQLKAACIPMNAGYYVPMPGNYIVKYGAYKKEKQEKMFRKEKDSVQNIIEDVMNQRSIPVKPGNFLLNRIGRSIYKSKLPQFPTLDRNFDTNEKCILCGVCEKVCPVNNIRIEENKPQWQGNCEHCMACIQWCPVQAIDYSAVTVGRERYHQPCVRADELYRKA